MSFIGTLEQCSLLTILQKIEGEAKNGVLIIKLEAQWVELSFRQGQLMCIGPVRSNKTLGDRLLQAGVISQKALQEISSRLGSSLQNETSTVITLMDLGYLNQDSLYIWAAQEATRILQVLLGWTSGEIYFEEGVQPPPDRLLIALTISSLVPFPRLISHSQSVNANLSSSTHTSDALPLHESSQFYGASTISSTSNSKNFSVGYATDVVRNTDALTYSADPISVPKRFAKLQTPKHIDTAFMQPQMVLNPTDLSGIRDRNLCVQLTPEQWCLFTVADGKTTLQMACQQLVMSREQLCQLAGELIALSLVTVDLPDSMSMHDSNLSPFDLAYVGFSNRDYFSSLPIETHSQWGNGGTGATFVLGNGWVVASSPSQSFESSERYNSSAMEFAETSGIR